MGKSIYVKKQDDLFLSSSLLKAVDFFGGQQLMANAIGIKQSNLSNIINGKRKLNFGL